MENETARDAFVTSYLHALLWSAPDVPDDADWSDEATDALVPAARAWYDANAAHVHCEGAPLAQGFEGSVSEREAAMAGHDFALTRNGHGAGFWDGDWPEPAASELTAAAGREGAVEPYLGDDGLVYV